MVWFGTYRGSCRWLERAWLRLAWKRRWATGLNASCDHEWSQWIPPPGWMALWYGKNIVKQNTECKIRETVKYKIMLLLVKYSLCAMRSTLTTPIPSLSSSFFLWFRCQQIGSLHQIRENFGHARSLATVQNQTWVCTQPKLRSSWCVAKNEVERIHSCFLLKSLRAREEFVNDQQHLGLSAAYRIRYQNDIRI